MIVDANHESAINIVIKNGKDEMLCFVRTFDTETKKAVLICPIVTMDKKEDISMKSSPLTVEMILPKFRAVYKDTGKDV